jgi:hypothetical protein
LTTHSKKMHSLALEKGKLGCPSTHIKGLRWQNHVAMNMKVFSDLIIIVWWNKQKAVAHTKIIAIAQWDWL